MCGNVRNFFPRASLQAQSLLLISFCDGSSSNVFCVCGSPFYVFFFSFRLA